MLLTLIPTQLHTNTHQINPITTITLLIILEFLLRIDFCNHCPNIHRVKPALHDWLLWIMITNSWVPHLTRDGLCADWLCACAGLCTEARLRFHRSEPYVQYHTIEQKSNRTTFKPDDINNNNNHNNGDVVMRQQHFDRDGAGKVLSSGQFIDQGV